MIRDCRHLNTAKRLLKEHRQSQVKKRSNGKNSDSSAKAETRKLSNKPSRKQHGYHAHSSESELDSNSEVESGTDAENDLETDERCALSREKI